MCYGLAKAYDTFAEIIYNIHNDQSISTILRDKSYPVKLVEKKFERDK